jgi:D-beta-D-heptose 7-phosphate kinase/D-beta-D-heptose 1-phosphate adenosyltransferase
MSSDPTTKDLNAFLDHFDKTTVLVIGDLMLDRYMYGTVSRLSPEAPVPVVDIIHEVYRLGGAGNAITNIRLLRGNVIPAGVVGDDWFGRQLIGLLNQDAIDTTGIIECTERPTTVKTRVIAEQHHMLRLDREIRNPISSVHEDAILHFLQDSIASVDAILISDYNKGVITRTLLGKIISLAEKSDKPVIVYPKIENSFDYKGVHTFITTLENAVQLTEIKQINETSIRNLGQWLLTRLESDHLLILRGKEGMSLFDKNGNVTHISPIPTEFTNISGTIDTVACIIALSLHSCNNHLSENIVRLANIGAGIAPVHTEPYSITQKDLRSKIKDYV